MNHNRLDVQQTQFSLSIHNCKQKDLIGLGSRCGSAVKLEKIKVEKKIPGSLPSPGELKKGISLLIY
jgi:hypothetical protein